MRPQTATVVGLIAGALLVAGTQPADADGGNRPERPAGQTRPSEQRPPESGPATGGDPDRALTVTGRGYGHGIGMSQYGAEGAARRGLSYREILRFYYPGTRFVRRHAFVRVHLTDDTSDPVVVRDAPGLKVRDRRDGRTFRLPDGDGARSWRIVAVSGHPVRSAVQYRDDDGWHRWPLPGRRLFRGDGAFRRRGPLRLVLPEGDVRPYRGSLRAAAPTRGDAERDTVNILRIQNYLKGVVPQEMPASWSQPALRAQAVAARSYALRLIRNGGHEHYDLCDTTACQVYDGYGAEESSTNAAVAATGGVALAYHGAPALTMFSSSSGGWTASGGTPYLSAHRDRYDRWSGNPMRSWSLGVAPGRLEHAYPSLGRFERARITRRNGHGAWGGRVLRVRLIGTRANVRVSGEDLRWALGLPSDWFRLSRHADSSLLQR